MRRSIGCLVVALALGACCAPPRYWRAREVGTSRIGYAVDTPTNPVGAPLAAGFVGPDGEPTLLPNYTLESIDAATWTSETGRRAHTVQVTSNGSLVCVARIVSAPRSSPPAK